ncbi:hypothetical protein [Microbulbifer sp. SAOS-129_SWC]|uniref:hypothetical protein n=1 Tax=Microbulbifer sp. SAOS-129_SWC TaxID=3145235 RepID=UPI003216511C
MRLILALLTFITAIAHADSYHRFAGITCIEEAGYLEIRATGISNIFMDGIKPEVMKAIKEKSNLHYGKNIEQSCKLGKYSYTTQIKFQDSQSRGRCMGNPGGYITLKRNGKTIIDNVSFDWDCDWPDLDTIKVQWYKFVHACGIDHTQGERYNRSFCIDYSGARNPIINKKEITRKLNRLYPE